MKEYYTTGEFAKLFQIDKQTLIYYDNQGIFLPAHKDARGYRQYSMTQVSAFSKILSLRNLHVRGQLLSDFNTEPTSKKLLEILQDKVIEYEEQVQSLQKVINSLHKKIQHLEKTTFCPADHLMLIPRSTIYYQRSPLFDQTVSLHDAWLKSAPLISEYASHLFDKDLQLSILPSIPSPNELNRPYPRWIILLTEDPTLLENPLTFPPSLYLTYITSTRAMDFESIKPLISHILPALSLKTYHQIFLTPMAEHCKIEIAVQ